MDLAWRYPLIVQIVERNGYDVFFGYVPDFGIETFEVVDPGNRSQEIMFHLKVRRMIEEALSVRRVEKKDIPPLRSARSLSYYNDACAQDMRSYAPSETVSTTIAAQMLGVHENTIRALFDTGVLKGALTRGGQRLILVTSLQEEDARMTHRAEMRKLEQRLKKKNAKRRQKRTEKLRKEKRARLCRDISETSTNMP